MQGTSISNRELWQNALVQIELGTSETSFRTWFRNTDIGGRDGGTVHVSVPSKIVKEWLMEKHHKLILGALRGLDSSILTIEYTVHRSAVLAPERKMRQQPQENASLGLQDFYIDKRDNLNPRYTFDTFVVGPFNQLAHAAAKAVLERPGLAYNPLFIYGSTGRGKTHLIQAIGNYFKKAHANKKVLYVTSERFAVDYINAVRTGRANNFKDQYRQYDILIMDEPTDGLDPNQKHQVRSLIREMAASKAIVVSTHILEEVEAVCSRAVIIAEATP